jgi:Flp pilus assembly pilin Flp
MLRTFWNDDNGFVISAELVLVATILVIGMIVGLSEVQHAVVQELNDVGDAIGAVYQGYYYTGFHSFKTFGGGVKSFTFGSEYRDTVDDCDYNQCELSCAPPRREEHK